MAKLTYDWQNLLVHDASNLVSDRDPRQYGWGFFAYDDFVLASTAIFLSFKSLDELLTFIAEVEPHAHLEDEPDKLAALTDRLGSIQGGWQKGGIKSITTLREALNQALKGYLSIEWLGQFNELCNGEGDFGARVIKDFWEDEPDDEVTESKPVPTNKIQAFVKFVKNYGF